MRPPNKGMKLTKPGKLRSFAAYPRCSTYHGRPVRALARAIIGIVLVFIVHIPRLLFTLLQLSYAAVFANTPTLTADPKEHLARARKMLRRGKLSELLYAALEIRFALERMTRRELVFAEMASKRMLKQYEPAKHVSNLHRLAPESAFGHNVYLLNKATGQKFKLAQYKPLDQARVAEIQGRLGDLLHPKEGLLLGVPKDPWYSNTRRFLEDSLHYLSDVYSDNSPFFAYQGLDQFEMVRVE
jgi:hypothetical protein